MNRGLDGRPDLRRGAEEPVRRGESLQGLVGTLEVVVLDEQGHAPLTVVEVGEHRAGQELLPQGLPEPLDLAAGLRMMRPALHVLDALALKLFLEPRHATPGGVLPALIGQDLPRGAVLGDSPGQGLHHEFAPLMVSYDEAHQIPGVVIEERGHVYPLMLPKQEREQVRLPELIGLGSLEAFGLGLGLGLSPRLLLRQALGLEHPPDCRLGRPDAEEPAHHIPDPAAPGGRVLRLHRQDRPPTWVVRRPLAALGQCRGQQCLLPAASIAGHPGGRRRIGHPELLCHLARVQPFIHRCPRHRKPKLSGPGAPRLAAAIFLLCLVRPRHMSPPKARPCQATSEDKC